MYCKKFGLLFLLSSVFWPLFACQPEPWKIPSELEIESEYLTVEQASVALFGSYDKENQESTWNMRKDRDFFDRIKGHELTVAPDQDIILTTQYRSADVSRKHSVALLYTTSFGIMDTIENSQAYGIVSVLDSQKSESTWKLIQQSHIIIELAHLHYERLDNWDEVGKLEIGKDNVAFHIYTPGGGIAGVHHGHSHLIAKVGQTYRNVFTYAKNDSYCPYSDGHDLVSDQSCAGMEASIEVLSCNRQLCPIELTVDGSMAPNLGKEEFAPGVYRFDGKEYVRQP